MTDPVGQQKIKTYCSLCIARCGAVATVEDGRFVSLEPDPTHPTGKALCAKGRASPELVYSPDRILHPLKRTRPKGDPDPNRHEQEHRVSGVLDRSTKANQRERAK